MLKTYKIGAGGRGSDAARHCRASPGGGAKNIRELGGWLLEGSEVGFLKESGVT